MSGQLVGEVLDAAEAGHLDGLSERGFHALIAIAEKCHAQTRQGSVRWDRVRAGLCGASLRTAKRAVEDLQRFGALRLVKRGFDNHAGRACAPIYEIQPLGQRVTQVTQSPQEPTGHIGEPTGHIREPTGHPGVLLDGSIDGPTDGDARASAAPEQPPRCSKHINDTKPPSCHACKALREDWETMKSAEAEAQRQARAEAVARRDNCPDCDDLGWLLGSDGLPANIARKCDRHHAVAC